MSSDGAVVTVSTRRGRRFFSGGLACGLRDGLMVRVASIGTGAGATAAEALKLRWPPSPDPMSETPRAASSGSPRSSAASAAPMSDAAR